MLVHTRWRQLSRDGPHHRHDDGAHTTRCRAQHRPPLCAMKVQRLRVTFARGDLLRYITHLDLMRSWERAIKRAELPIAYSEGFTRHPQLALAAPLPVGATAEGELMDVYLESALEPKVFHDRLARQTPPGLTIEQVEE